MGTEKDKGQVPSILSKVNVPGDKALAAIIGILTAISVLAVYSSVAKMGYNPYGAKSTAGYLQSHLASIFLAAVTFGITFLINAVWYRRLTWLGYAVSLALTVAVYFVGAKTNNAARWIPIMGFNFQPSELLKITTIMVLAQQLAVKQHCIEKLRLVPSLLPWRWRERRQKAIWRKGTLPILLPIVLSCAVILPAHFSSSFIVFISAMLMLFIGRVRKREIAKICAVVALFVALFLGLGFGRSSTAFSRFTTFYEVLCTDRTAVKVDELTDPDRSMVAIHDGGIVGRGAGRSIMRAKITHPESDFIFAFFTEEYGLIMAVFLLALYMWILVRAIKIFARCTWIYAGLLELGLALLVTLQAVIHIMVTVNLFPETGQNLPLISHGGSSMVCTALALGMILGISRQIDQGTLIPPMQEEEEK